MLSGVVVECMSGDSGLAHLSVDTFNDSGETCIPILPFEDEPSKWSQTILATWLKVFT